VFVLKCQSYHGAGGCASTGAEDGTRAGVEDGAVKDGAGADVGPGTIADAGASTVCCADTAACIMVLRLASWCWRFSVDMMLLCWQ
jgi:hypothetical protein